MADESPILNESGAGQPVLWLADAHVQELTSTLGKHFHVMALSPEALSGKTAQDKAASLLAAVTSRGIENIAVMTHGEHADIALHLAATAGDLVQMLVLLSPQAIAADGMPRDLPLKERLADIKAQTLALFGSRDQNAPPSVAGHYKRALGSCHLMFVYDAADTSCERPEAVSEVVVDFIQRREAFLVNNRDGRVFA